MRVVRLLDLYATANQLAQRVPFDENLLAHTLKEWSYVYKRATVSEQGEYHQLVSSL